MIKLVNFDVKWQKSAVLLGQKKWIFSYYIEKWIQNHLNQNEPDFFQNLEKIHSSKDNIVRYWQLLQLNYVFYLTRI